MMSGPPFARGASLPPGVIGELLGTLTIRLQACSLVDVFARVQFWGEQTYSDLSLLQESLLVGSKAVEYPLLGSIDALCSYLMDASPLKVTFLRYPQDHQQLRTEERGSNSVQLQPEIVGYAYIRDICIKDLPRVEQEGALKTVKLSLIRDSPIVSPGTDLDCQQINIGEAGFELLFRVLACPNVNAATARQHEGSAIQGLPAHQAMLSSVTLPTDAPHRILRYLNTTPSIAQHASVNKDFIQSITDDSNRESSDFCVSDNEEKHSLLEELLDLCNDDMTIPTVDSANTCIDPYEMWISRMIANASSPPAKDFPSLLSAGSRQSSAIREIGTMKIEVTGITLLTRIANKINGENDFILQYNPPPLTFDHGKPVGISDFIVCERFCKQHKMTTSIGRTLSKDVKPRGNEKVISLLKSAYARQMEVVFKDDDCVRMWLDGTMDFSLFYRASISSGHSKLPRVAMLVGRGKETNTVPKPGSMCVAKACLRLRDVILSDTLSFDVKLQLLLTKNELAKHIGEVGTKVGTLTVRVGLYAVDKSHGASITRSSPDAREEPQILMKVPISSSSFTPHPISVLLSNIAGASNGNAVAMPTSNTKCVSSVGSHEISQTAQHNENPLMAKKSKEQHTPLQPVKVPPIWLDVRVERISKLTVEDIDEKSGCFKLGVSCSKQMLSLCELTHSQSDIKKFEEDPEEILTLTSNEFNAIQNTVCSWKVPIDAESKRDNLSTVSLYVWYCKNASSQQLVGLANIPLLIEPPDMSEKKLCNWLPCIVANSTFDLLDPKSHTPIGNVKVLVAAGLLRQVRVFSAICQRAIIVQRWWRRSRRAVAREKEACTLHQYISTKRIAQQDCDPDVDTIHARFVSQDVTGFRGHTRDSASSPDSLFDEWSQQSLSTINDGNNGTVQHKGPAHAKPTSDEIQHATHASTDSSTARKRDDINDDDKPPEVEEDKAQSVNFSDCVEPKPATSEHTTYICDVEKESREGFTIPYEHFNLIVRLEKISGIREILSAWCSEQRRAVSETLLLVSGFFVSFSHGNAIQSQEEELRKLCSGDDSHSKLISIDGMARDVEVNYESKISVPNYENDTEMILTQSLQFKLWFVPVITTTIAAMIDAGKTKDIISLKGCTVISTAKCPLYHLYSIKGCYSGRVPWSMALHRSQNANYFGYISTSMCRVKIHPCPIRMLLALNERCGPENAVQCPVMSTLKPTKLDVSFSHEQDEHIRQSVGIDPPEEIKQDFLPPSSKRSSNAPDIPRECKRYRVEENLESPCYPPKAAVDPLYDELHKSTTSDPQEIGEESEVISQGELSSAECEQYSDADDAMTCRSLTSMIGSLDNINSKLTRGADDPTVKFCASNELVASSQVGANSNAIDDDARRYEFFGTPSENDIPSQKSKPDCPGRQIEPPEENYASGTPVDQRAEVTGCDGDRVKTSEKGSSPMSTNYYVNAASGAKKEFVDSEIEDARRYENQDEHHKSAEKNDSDRLLDESTLNGNFNCQHAGGEFVHYQTKDGMQQGEAPRRHGSLLSMPSNPRGVVQYHLGERQSSVLSPHIHPSIPSRFDFLTREASSWGGRVDSNPSNIRANATMFNKERLERIFRS